MSGDDGNHKCIVSKDGPVLAHAEQGAAEEKHSGIQTRSKTKQRVEQTLTSKPAREELRTPSPSVAKNALVRKRKDMGQAGVNIHEDITAWTQELDSEHVMSPIATNVPFSDVYGESEDDDSDDEEREIDETVADDMHKLEQDFKGISQKYRLINRIGEGML